MYGKGQEMEQVSVLDVAQFILDKRGSMSTMKLQKLTYYAQAWAMVWQSGPIMPLLDEDFEAWIDRPDSVANFVMPTATTR